MIFEQGFKGIQAFIFDINGGKEEKKEEEEEGRRKKKERGNYREKERKISELKITE